MVLSFSFFIYRIWTCISGLWICLSSEIPQWYYFDGKLAQVHIHSWKIKCWDFVISFLGNLLSWHTVSLYFNPYISRFFFIPCHSISFSIFSQQWQTFLSLALDIYPSLYLVFFMSFTWYFFFLIVAFIYRIIIHNNFSWSDAKCDSARFHKSKMKKKWDEEKKH